MKPKPTEQEFEELKRKRDEEVATTVADICKHEGWDPTKVSFHHSGGGKCYCACPDGPCQHIWDGPEVEEDNSSSSTCSRCGTSSMSHDIRYLSW